MLLRQRLTHALLENADWQLLKHLHQQIACAQAGRIGQGEKVPPNAYLISPSRTDLAQAPAQLAELSRDFVADLLQQPDGQHLLAKYLADAVHPGSEVHRRIAQEYGFHAQYTLSCQEAVLPQANGSLQPVLMVLLHGQGFALPIFHAIERIATGSHCQLRPFPDLEEFQAVQVLLEQRIQQGMTHH